MKCIQCTLRTQDCVYPPLTKKRIRRAKAAEESLAKKAKLNEQATEALKASTGMSAGPVLLKKDELAVLMNLQRGAHNCTMEEIIQLAMSQKAKIDHKKRILADLKTSPKPLRGTQKLSEITWASAFTRSCFLK